MVVTQEVSHPTPTCEVPPIYLQGNQQGLSCLLPILKKNRKSCVTIWTEKILDVFEDFDAHQVDWERVLDIQGNDQCHVTYVETLSLPDRW